MSAATGGYGGGGIGGDELFQPQQHQHQHQHQQHQQNRGGGGQMYHVPQHSRREKLRFPPEESPPTLFCYSTIPTPRVPARRRRRRSSSSSIPRTCSRRRLPLPLTIPAASGLIPPLPLPLPLPLQQQQGFSLSLSSSSSNPPRGVPVSAGPCGPFTGYAAVLNRSRFLGPAQQLLEEVCHVGRRAGVGDGGGGGDGSGDEGGLLDMDPSETISAVDRGSDGGQEGPIAAGVEQQWKKTRLISLMEEVSKRYKQYYQQVHAVITSFESVAGLSTAAPYASMALKAMSKHFKCLKSMISNQLRQTNKVLGKEGINKEDISSFGLVSGGICLQRANNMGNFGQPHVWRPQRGLPERAVAVLRAWLFEHFLHPYPTDTDKQMLAKQTALFSISQVSNWFINARVRLWKPMVEEIHNLEMRQSQKLPSADNDQSGIQQSHQPSDSSSNPSGHSGGIDKNHNSTSKCIQSDVSQIPNSNIHEPINFVYDGLNSQQHIGVGVGLNGGNGGGVSLTLGLHQNNRVCLAEPLPLTMVHRFGLEDCNEAYMMGSFEGQDRQFSKDISGHLLHDFVG
uniref:Homeobox domain-containing protein n=1 Tax=Ananas comosus var. bracteatus TaxID=296719 RepID=A0A6V7QUM0_ANACO